MTQPPFAQQAVYSQFESDPDLKELVELFIEEMPGRVANIVAQHESGNLEELLRTTHQLMGAAGGYGFDQVTPYAGILESKIQGGGTVEEIRGAVDDLVTLCQRLRVGRPD